MRPFHQDFIPSRKGVKNSTTFLNALVSLTALTSFTILSLRAWNNGNAAWKIFDCLKLFHRFFMALGAFLKPAISASNALSKSKTLSSQSRNLTIASPTKAVTSRMLRLNRPSILVMILNAIFRGPAVNVITMSSIAKTPAKVLRSLSACCSFMINLLVNLLKPAIRLNSASERYSMSVEFGNISCQACPIALNTSMSAFPMFLKPLIINQRPFISSSLSINSSNGIPSLAAVFLSSLRATICLSL